MGENPLSSSNKGKKKKGVETLGRNLKPPLSNTKKWRQTRRCASRSGRKIAAESVLMKLTAGVARSKPIRLCSKPAKIILSLFRTSKQVTANKTRNGERTGLTRY